MLGLLAEQSVLLANGSCWNGLKGAWWKGELGPWCVHFYVAGHYVGGRRQPLEHGGWLPNLGAQGPFQAS